MSGIIEQTGSVTASPLPPARRLEAPAAETPAAPHVEDRLNTTAKPTPPSAPAELVERIKALREPATPAPGATSAVKLPEKDSGFWDPVGNLVIGVLSGPIAGSRFVVERSVALLNGGASAVSHLTGLPLGAGFLVRRIRGVMRQGARLVRGTAKAKEFVHDAAEAEQKDRLGAFVRSEAKVAETKVAARATRAVKLVREGDVKSAWRAIAPAKKAAEEGAVVAGRWARTARWAGRIGRFAPVLNIPLAGLDLHAAWQTFAKPDATRQEKVSAGGRAALSSAAAGLAIAGLVTPPPLNLTLLAASGSVGLASTLWSVLSSQRAVALYRKAGGFLGGLLPSPGGSKPA